MSSLPSLEPVPARFPWYFLNTLLLGFYVVVFHPIGALGGYGLHLVIQTNPRWRWGLWGSALGSLVWLGITKPFWFFYPGSEWPTAILVSAPLIPLAAAVIEPVWKMSMILKPRSLREQIEEEKAKLDRQQNTLSEQAGKEQGTVPPGEVGQLQLGVFMQGDQFPKHLGITHKQRWVSLADSVLDQHVFVLGATGAGKSETLKRLIFEVLANTDRDIYVVDGKGEEPFAEAIQQLCVSFGRGESPVFRLGQKGTGAAYNGFVGQAEDIYNRLAAMVGVSEAEGDAQFYADMNRNLLQLVCYAPDGPPRSFAQVIERLDKAWLEEAWQDDMQELLVIEEIKSDHIISLRNRVLAVARPLKALVTPDGFVLEQTRSAVFSIRTQSVSDTAKRFLYFLIEDIKDFVGKRQERPGLLIIDEFGMFGNQNVVALLSLARSANLGVILATQDIATLGDPATARMILANTRTKILMATDYPEEVGQLAGTIYQIESSIQHDEGETTGMGSARIQHAFKVDMNEAGKLRPGEAFLIRQRHACKLRVAQV